ANPRISPNSPKAAETGARPATRLTTAMVVSADARPNEPSAGSLTSMMVAPPSRAACASSADRTLTKSSAIDTSNRGRFHLKETHPARIAAKRQGFQTREDKTVNDGSLKPGRIVQVFLPVRGKGLDRTVMNAFSQFADPNETANQLGMRQ